LGGWKNQISEQVILKGFGGHIQVVNCVHWNPSDTFIVASSSDDHTIRIWGLEEMPLADVIYDQKEMKRVDGINSVPNGKP